MCYIMSKSQSLKNQTLEHFSPLSLATCIYKQRRLSQFQQPSPPSSTPSFQTYTTSNLTIPTPTENGSSTNLHLPRGDHALPCSGAHQPHDEHLQATSLQEQQHPRNLRTHRRMALLPRVRSKAPQPTAPLHPQRCAFRAHSLARPPRLLGSSHDQHGSTL